MGLEFFFLYRGFLLLLLLLLAIDHRFFEQIRIRTMIGSIEQTTRFKARQVNSHMCCVLP